MMSSPPFSPPPLPSSARPQLHSAHSSFRSHAAPPTLSPLITRSSSTTRVPHTVPEWTPADSLTPRAADDPHRVWRREGHGRKGSVQTKGDAIVTVAGVPSSGASSSSDGSPPTPLHVGLTRLPNLIEGDVLPDSSFERRGRQQRAVGPSPEQIIKWHLPQSSPLAPQSNLDNLLQFGVSDYTFVLSPETPRSPRSPQVQSPPLPSSPQPAKGSPKAGQKESVPEPAPHPRRVSLGKGKFSEVLLVRKNGVEFALKHTPLHPHHPLIATRLLREPTILAQLLPHPNLVKVYETIRTPGHFYLVEENLSSHVTLEHLVASSPGGILSDELAWSVLDQLASVVRSLHEPLRVCHRDIKPENILVQYSPPSSNPSPSSSPSSITPSGAQLQLKLLDFGLATHFSGSEPKLSTCCGSPAYHSPELWRALREAPGGLRYWGPEVDIWCVALTLLRCLTPHKYPLGIAHSSLQAIGAKVADAILTVENPQFQVILAALLTLDGEQRMTNFLELVRDRALDSSSTSSPVTPITPTTPFATSSGSPPAIVIDRARSEFKSSTFIPAPAKHSLDLPLLAGSQLPDGPRPLEVHAAAEISVDYQAPPPPIELVLLNPTNEPIQRAASYVKYALRCAGVLYHVREDGSRLDVGSEDNYQLILECAVPLPKEAAAGASKASNALIAALRPAGPQRSSSVPTGPRAGANGAQSKKKEPPPPPVPTLRFFLSVKRAPGLSSKHSKRRSAAPVAPRVVLSLSDARARAIVRDALKLDHADSPQMHSPRVGLTHPALAATPAVSATGSGVIPTPVEESGRRGRAARGEAHVRGNKENSGSRAARDRRSAVAAIGDGLAMAMGPPATPATEENLNAKDNPSGGKGFFDFAAGYFSGRATATPTPAVTPGAGGF